MVPSTAKPGWCSLSLVALSARIHGASHAGCGQRELSAQESADRKAIVEATNAFAVDLYAQLRKEDGNLFASPASISTALAMTYAGARGQTAEQMAK